MKFAAGQRWFSQTEPELGLGLIESTQQHRIQVQFPAADEHRVYAEQRAPLQRYALKVGQRLTDTEGVSGEITAIEDTRGVLVYRVLDDQGAEQIVPEMLLAHELRLDAADKRLLSGQVNHLHWYQLRHSLRRQYADYQTQSARGLLGGRIQLTPHQYYVADAATRQGMPRILLSDEVGLGKTIEAGLILHRLEVEGRARRLLICVPDHLLHQWLVEMIRKFDMPFSVFDRSRLAALAEEDPEANPFDTEQRVLVPSSLWQEDERALALAAGVDWDVLVVDEAHHLDWHPSAPGPSFKAIEQLSRISQGVLLLTATPEQDGTDSHFARLQLLDPVQFNDLATYQATEAQLQTLSDNLAEFLAAGPDSSALDPWCQDAYGQDLLARVRSERSEQATQALVDYLIDVHGTGRIQYRNTRDRIQGFPDRQVTCHELPCPAEFPADHPYPETQVMAWTEDDPRVAWLSEFLNQTSEKVLVICHHMSTARGLEGHLRLREGHATAQFHEDMDLIERDRAAAYFADPHEGAQALICSEIGSEGRNFQFAHTLVCFDLPPHPDLLEQRIGRLDRIGQTRNIDIHVPVLTGQLSHHWFLWYHEGLDAFTQTNAVGEAVLWHLLSNTPAPHSLLDLPLNQTDTLPDQIQQARQWAVQLAAERRAGKHKLLEWHSFNREAAETLLEDISEFEARLSPEPIVIEALESLGIEVEDEGQGIFSVMPGEKMIPDHFPLTDEDEMCLITFRRSVAVSREDVRFITWEHPLIDFLLETLDGTHLGSAGVTLISLPELPKGSLYLEASFLPLMQSPHRRQATLFLPQALFTRVVDQNGQDVSRAFQDVDWRDLEKRLEKNTLLEIIKTQQPLIQSMIEQVREQAVSDLQALVNEAAAQVSAHQEAETARLESHAERTGRDIADEQERLTTEAQAIREAITQAELHLDTVRLVVNF